MNNTDYTWVAPLVAFLVAAIGWLFRELHFRRERKTQATRDATQILRDQKVHVEELISKADDPKQKESLSRQLDEINDKLRGLYAVNLRRTLKDANLPPEDMLLVEGKSQLQQQQVTKLREEIAEAESLPQSDSIQELFTLTNAYYYTEQYDKAKETSNRILELSPDNSVVLYNRGVIYDNLERYEEAMADYSRALELKPDFAEALNNRGVFYAKLERYDEALSDFNHALELRPDAPSTLCNRGNAYILLGMYDEALSDLNQSLRLNPSEPAAFHNLGCLYEILKRYDEALSNFNRSLEIRPDDPITLYRLACLLSLQGNSDDALDYLKKAISKDKKLQESAKTDKDFDNIRDAPRFKKLIEPD